MKAPEQKRAVPFDGNVIVGKDILELLSSAMYVDPLSIYREYVQNAADAIDDAGTAGLYGKRSIPPIVIKLDPTNRIALIKDEGAGITNAAFVRTLTSIGGSAKRGKASRGFRGVGRLAGLGYCQELVMRSRAFGDREISEMRWDCKRLKELLRDASDRSLREIVGDVVTVSRYEASSDPSHFFEVELRGISRFRNDLLLNEEIVGRYLSEVGPVPFHSSFSFGDQINEFFSRHRIGPAFETKLNGAELFRPHRNDYEAKLNTPAKFKTIEFFEIPGVTTGIDAMGWLLHGEYLGAIPERSGIQGLRIRAGNIQIGNSRVLDSIFAQQRFNAWAVGECHITSPKLLPNARRDDLEQGTHRSNLITRLAPKAAEILKTCRAYSSERTRVRKATAIGRSAESFDWVKAKCFFQKNSGQKLSSNQRMRIAKKLQNGGLTYDELLKMLTEPTQSGR